MVHTSQGERRAKSSTHFSGRGRGLKAVHTSGGETGGVINYTLVGVEDAELLQEEAVVEDSSGHPGQELEDDALLRAQEDHGVVAVGPSRVVHGDARQAVPGAGSKRL